MSLDEDPEKWTREERKRLGELCRRANTLFEGGDGPTLGQAIARAAAQMDLTLEPRLEERVLLTIGRVALGGGIEAYARRGGFHPGQN